MPSLVENKKKLRPIKSSQKLYKFKLKRLLEIKIKKYIVKNLWTDF